MSQISSLGEVLLSLAFVLPAATDGMLASVELKNPTIATSAHVFRATDVVFFVTVGEPVVVTCPHS